MFFCSVARVFGSAGRSCGIFKVVTGFGKRVDIHAQSGDFAFAHGAVSQFCIHFQKEFRHFYGFSILDLRDHFFLAGAVFAAVHFLAGLQFFDHAPLFRIGDGAGVDVVDVLAVQHAQKVIIAASRASVTVGHVKRCALGAERLTTGQRFVERNGILHLGSRTLPGSGNRAGQHQLVGIVAGKAGIRYGELRIAEGERRGSFAFPLDQIFICIFTLET